MRKWVARSACGKRPTKRVQNFEPGPSWVFYGYTAHVEEWSLGG